MMFKVFIRISRSNQNFRIRFRGLVETAEAASAVNLRPQKTIISNDFLEFLGEFEALFEWKMKMKKTEGRKSRDIVPLNTLNFQ
jgi:hypothetical protein